MTVKMQVLSYSPPVVKWNVCTRYQIICSYIHQDLRMIVPSTRVVKKDLREEVGERF